MRTTIRSIRSTRFGWVLAAALMIAAPAAAENSYYARTGPYVGTGLALGFDNFDGVGNLDLSTGVGFDIWGGFRIIPNLAVEAQLEYIDRVNIGPLELDVFTFTANVKGYLLTGRIQPFLLAGIGASVWDANAFSSASGFSARFGGGVDFYLSERFDFALQMSTSYVVTTGDIDGLDYVSLIFGAQYLF